MKEGKLMMFRNALIVSCFALSIFAGCSSDDQAVDDGTTQKSATDGGSSADSATSTDSDVSSDSASSMDSATPTDSSASTDADAAVQGNGVTVAVSYDGQSSTVDLGSVATSTYKESQLVKLSDLWTASKFSVDPSTLQFEFVASDGFKPSNKGCPDLSGSVLAQGYIDPTSRYLTWDEALGFKGCYSVKDVAKINAHAPVAADAGIADAAAE